MKHNKPSLTVEQQLLDKLANTQLSKIKKLALQNIISSISTAYDYSFNENERDLVKNNESLDNDDLEYLTSRLLRELDNDNIHIESFNNEDNEYIMVLKLHNQEFFEIHSTDKNNEITEFLFSYIAEREKVEAIYSKLL